MMLAITARAPAKATWSSTWTFLWLSTWRLEHQQVKAPDDRLPEAGGRLVGGLLQPVEGEARVRERGDRGLDGGSAGQDCPGRRPEAEQPGAWLRAVREGLTDQHPPTRTDHPAQLAGAGGQVAEVVDDGRQPGAVAAAIAQRQLLTPATDVGDPRVGAAGACLAAHALGRLHGHYVGAEPGHGRVLPGPGQPYDRNRGRIPALA
jgi:hypothetical protein